MKRFFTESSKLQIKIGLKVIQWIYLSNGIAFIATILICFLGNYQFSKTCFKEAGLSFILGIINIILTLGTSYFQQLRLTQRQREIIHLLNLQNECIIKSKNLENINEEQKKQEEKLEIEKLYEDIKDYENRIKRPFPLVLLYICICLAFFSCIFLLNGCICLLNGI